MVITPYGTRVTKTFPGALGVSSWHTLENNSVMDTQGMEFLGSDGGVTVTATGMSSSGNANLERMEVV